MTAARKQATLDRVFNVKIGLILREARKAEGLSQEYVGDLLGIDGTTVKRHEDGTTPLTCVRAARFAKIVGLTVADLFK